MQKSRSLLVLIRPLDNGPRVRLRKAVTLADAIDVYPADHPLVSLGLQRWARHVFTIYKLIIVATQLSVIHA